MANSLSADDRFEIEDLLGRYFWAVDTADVEAVVAVFTHDAVVRYGTGQWYEGPDGIRRFAIRAIGDHTARGRMHFNRPLFAELRGDAVLMRSYLISPRWTTHDDAMVLGTLRHTEDLFVRTTGGWRIKERAIFLWNDQTAPRTPDAGHKAKRDAL